MQSAFTCERLAGFIAVQVRGLWYLGRTCTYVVFVQRTCGVQAMVPTGWLTEPQSGTWVPAIAFASGLFLAWPAANPNARRRLPGRDVQLPSTS